MWRLRLDKHRKTFWSKLKVDERHRRFIHSHTNALTKVLYSFWSSEFIWFITTKVDTFPLTPSVHTEWYFFLPFEYGHGWIWIYSLIWKKVEGSNIIRQFKGCKKKWKPGVFLSLCLSPCSYLDFRLGSIKLLLLPVGLSLFLLQVSSQGGTAGR